MNQRVYAAGIILSSLLGAQVHACNGAIPASTPVSRFSVEGDEVTDKVTGLIWRRCSAGQSGTGCSGDVSTFKWDQALDYAEQQALASGVAWRLPNVSELATLVEVSCSSPAINSTLFPSTPGIDYWTNSPYVNSSTYAWAVAFGDGSTIFTTRYYTLGVRLVRGGF